MNLAKKSKKGYIILSEGNIDVVALHQAGLDCAVASLGTSLTSEQARLISNYVKEVVIAYDGDSAGRAASQRAIGILEKLDLKVRVLKITGAKDPDEYIVKYGAAAFENLISRSENHVEYRISEIAGKYSLEDEESRVAFLREAMDYISTMPGTVEREVYAGKVAEMAKVAPQSVISETENIRKKKSYAARKREERQNSHPGRTVQPRAKSLRYDNPRSARAEEGMIRLLWLEPELFAKEPPISEEDFCSPVLGRLYTELGTMAREGQRLSLSVLAEKFTPEEISHFTELVQKPQELQNSQKALSDYIDIIKTEKLAAKVGAAGEETLLEMSRKLRESKGYGGRK